MATLLATTIETKAAAHTGNVGNIKSTDSESNIDFSLSSTSLTEWTARRITITPTSTDSRILVQYALNSHLNQLTAGGSRSGRLMLYNYIGTTSSALGAIMSMRVFMENNDYTEHSSWVCHIDHPDTTSAVRYSMYADDNDSSIFYWQHAFAGDHDFRGVAMEVMGTPAEWAE